MENEHLEVRIKVFLKDHPAAATILAAALAREGEAQSAGLSSAALDAVGAITIVYLFTHFTLPWLVAGRVWTEQRAAKIIQNLHQRSEADPQELERAVEASKKLHKHLSQLSDARLQQPWIDLAKQLKSFEPAEKK